LSHYKKKYGSSGELLVAMFFMMRDYNVFEPIATGSRDLLVEIDDQYYGVQVKSVLHVYKDPRRNKQRYKFNLIHSSNNKGYDPGIVHIFACVGLESRRIIFFKNTGQKGKSISIEDFTKQKERASFEALLREL
tara:strand:- start:199 stop:600 length:402 start_codon:yes stop_codon:yes gene_type:complete